MTDNIRSKIAAWVDSEYGSCPVAGTQLLAFIDSQQAEVVALKAERDAAMKDAERYRYLRGQQHWSEALEKAIDAAIAEAEWRTK